MQEFMDAVHNQCANIQGLVHRLQKYSTAFYVLGNEKVSNDLRVMAEDLDQHQDIIRKEVGKELDRQFKQAQQSSLNVLNSALAGIKVAQAKEGRTVTGRPESQPPFQNLKPKER